MFIILQRLSDLEEPDTEYSEGEDMAEDMSVEEKAIDKEESDYYIWGAVNLPAD